MALGKRKRVSSKRAYRTSARVGNSASLARASRARLRPRSTQAYMVQRLSSQMQRINRTIETKDQVWSSGTNIGLMHNALYQVLGSGSGGRMNPFQIDIGAGDNMSNGGGRRIGDEVTVSRVVIRGMLENHLGRPKVNFRVMVIRSAKGDTPTRATLFRGNAGNKLIDGINTERFTIVAQRVITINSGNPMANSVTSAGVPLEAPQLVTGNAAAGIGTKLFYMSIPGRKFFRDGRVRYENESATQVKFYDFHVMIMTYDWFGTPQDTVDVGKINEMYCKTYYKDA